MGVVVVVAATARVLLLVMLGLLLVLVLSHPVSVAPLQLQMSSSSQQQAAAFSAACGNRTRRGAADYDAVEQLRRGPAVYTAAVTALTVVALLHRISAYYLHCTPSWVGYRHDARRDVNIVSVLLYRALSAASSVRGLSTV